MPQFTPPTVPQSSGDFFFGRYSIPVGQTVLRRNGAFETSPYPWLGELTGLTDGVDYFLGGHVYTVSDEVADELTAAGYDVTYSGGWGVGPYGQDGWGE